MAVVDCLHGFLGLPSDWDFLEPHSPIPLRKVDVFKILSPAAGASMAEWAHAFCASVARGPTREPRVLMGYSMGGRLALHALAAEPRLWSAAILVSANPGLPADDLPGRTARVAQDETWARRFESESWETVLGAWNRQPIFRTGGAEGTPALPRRETDFSRADLAGALRSWSLGAQTDFSSLLSRPPITIHWVVGEHDPKYLGLARRLGLEAEIIPGAGHRAPWENQAGFIAGFCGFLARTLLDTSPETPR